jgi:pSer/pThr/pTyr-binding forkhead associated (FHA) protein
VASVSRLPTLVVTRRCVLRVVRGVGLGKTLPLGDRRVLAGRGDDADLLIDDPAASRRHFEIGEQGGSYLLKDLRSTNGTQVNHVTVAECRLTNGDIITVGETDVGFFEETDVAPPRQGNGG